MSKPKHKNCPIKVFIWEWSDIHCSWERIIVVASDVEEARKLAFKKNPGDALLKIITKKKPEEPAKPKEPPKKP